MLLENQARLSAVVDACHDRRPLRTTVQSRLRCIEVEVSAEQISVDSHGEVSLPPARQTRRDIGPLSVLSLRDG
jgi:hypothetical protein